MTCRICRNEEGNTPYIVKEMMFGTHEEFSYFSCAQCGCVQISDYPQDASKYYGEKYYSFDPTDTKNSFKDSLVSRFRNRFLLSGKGILGKAMARWRPSNQFDAIGYLKLPFDARILDVGCGAGELLCAMDSAGYVDLTGVDPFIKADFCPAPHVKIIKGTLADMPTSYDFIMLNHSLEHMPDQVGQFREIQRLLAPNGQCMVRVPVADSTAWEEYRTDWVQLDAPRHFYLHTRASIDRLASMTGLKVTKVRDDSTVFQFAGSELYRRGKPLNTGAQIDWSAFSANEIAGFEKRAREVNAESRGDQSIFYLQHA